MELPLGTKIVAGAFATSGVIHMVRPQVFEPMIPRELGSRRAWVYGSGVAELACAAGLLTGQRWAPAVTTATLAAVWVGNAKMAVDVQRSSRPAWFKAAVWARMPLQVPLMRWAWNSPTR